MKGCKHRRWGWKDSLGVWLNVRQMVGPRSFIRRCLDCNELLPLGPAKLDGPHAEAIAIELRAAELAIAARNSHVRYSLERGLDSTDEGWGWYAEGDGELAPTLESIFDDEHSRRIGALAGWLARHVHTETWPP